MKKISVRYRGNSGYPYTITVSLIEHYSAVLATFKTNLAMFLSLH